MNLRPSGRSLGRVEVMRDYVGPEVRRWRILARNGMGALVWSNVRFVLKLALSPVLGFALPV